MYALQAENRKRVEEVRELQKASAARRRLYGLLMLKAVTACRWQHAFHPCSPLQTPPYQALSDAHTFLFEERERLLALTAENDSECCRVGASVSPHIRHAHLL